jgi:hypothetical protein
MSTYEEIRDAMVDILSGREQVTAKPEQWVALQNETALVLARRAGRPLPDRHGMSLARLSPDDAELARDVFWDLFRQGFITLGLNDSNPQWPFFRLSHFGKTRLVQGRPYQFTDTSTYIAMVRSYSQILDPITQMYLEEAVSSFYAGCHLASAVMLGVAAEKMFVDLLDIAAANPTYAVRFQTAVKERHILPKMKRFLRDLDQLRPSLPKDLFEDLETHFAAIQAIIRRGRNDAGHPTGASIEREHAYVNLQLFPPFARKVSQLTNVLK